MQTKNLTWEQYKEARQNSFCRFVNAYEVKFEEWQYTAYKDQDIIADTEFMLQLQKDWVKRAENELAHFKKILKEDREEGISEKETQRNINRCRSQLYREMKKLHEREQKFLISLAWVEYFDNIPVESEEILY